MEGRAIGVVEPIARIEGQQFQFGALGQFRGLVNEQTTGMNACLDGHAREPNTDATAQQGVGADALRPARAGLRGPAWRRHP